MLLNKRSPCPPQRWCRGFQLGHPHLLESEVLFVDSQKQKLCFPSSLVLVIFLFIKMKAYIIIMRCCSIAALSFCVQTGFNAAVSVSYFSSGSLSSVTQALKHKWVTTISHLVTRLCFFFSYTHTTSQSRRAHEKSVVMLSTVSYDASVIKKLMLFSAIEMPCEAGLRGCF